MPACENPRLWAAQWRSCGAHRDTSFPPAKRQVGLLCYYRSSFLLQPATSSALLLATSSFLLLVMPGATFVAIPLPFIAWTTWIQICQAIQRSRRVAMRPFTISRTQGSSLVCFCFDPWEAMLMVLMVLISVFLSISGLLLRRLCFGSAEANDCFADMLEPGNPAPHPN